MGFEYAVGVSAGLPESVSGIQYSTLLCITLAHQTRSLLVAYH